MKVRNTSHTAARVAVAAAILLGLVAVGMVWMRTNELKRKNAELSEKIEDAVTQRDILKEELAAPFDDAYVMRVARRKLGYCLPNEIIYFSEIDE